MARDKVTITLDRSKAGSARALMGSSSTSAVIDLALDQLIKAERLRQDVAAYRRDPPAAGEIAPDVAIEAPDLADETDWATLYGIEE